MRLTRIVRAAASRPKTTIALWLLFVVACTVAGGIAGTKTLKGDDSSVGESAVADKRLKDAGLRERAAERVLVRSSSAATTDRAADVLTQRLKKLPEVASALSGGARGTDELVVVSLRGDPEDAADHVAPIERTVANLRAETPGVQLLEAGDGTGENAFNDVLETDLRKAERFSLPITLAVLLIAFGAIVAASVPLLLGVTSVAAAMGAFGVVSHVVPDGGTTGPLVVLIGLAVGVDYSLFYIRREREERRNGRGPDAALETAAATVGRAIVVSGLTVMVAIGGLLITGLQQFASMAVGTIIVVAIAVLGSLTVLPATLALLGDRIDRGRLPGLGKPRVRRGIWGAVAGAATRHPAAALVTAVALMGALAVPATQLKIGDAGGYPLPKEDPVAKAQKAIEQAFPGSPAPAELVVTGKVDLHAIGRRALRITGGGGGVQIERRRGVAKLSVPMPDRGLDYANRTVERLRAELPANALVTGEAAANQDWTDRLHARTPVVIAFVLTLAFVLLLAAFRSPALAAAVMGLNLLSVGAVYGVLAAVFQHQWAEGLLGFESTGSVASWIPLFCFVILFGLSMDYTIVVLERMREARRAGRSAREAAAEGVAATGGTVTSAALVMVAVFAVFAMLRIVENKQLGVGLATAVLLDATIVRGVALPAVVTLLGERRWRVRPARVRRGWEHGPVVTASTN
jgi:uncharacterized membrane protein YdfJ with MMPL/SSD domain